MTPRGYGPAAAFCPRCAAPLDSAPPTVCSRCDYRLYANPRPSAGLIVLDRRPPAPRFLAVKRVLAPRAGRWELPGGFCDGWEHPAAAAVREGREELGVEVTLGDFVGMYVGSYDFQGERLPVLDCFFLASAPGDRIVLDGREACDLAWFALDDPPPLAFDTMDRALRDARRQLFR